MNSVQKNHLAMGRSVNKLVADPKNAALLVAVPALGTDNATLAGNITTIEERAEEQAHSTAGVTLAKKQDKEKLATAALIVAGGLRRWARSVGNTDVLKQATITRSDIVHGDDSAAVTVAGTINDLGAANAAALLPFNVDAGKLAALDNAWKAIKGSVQSPRAQVVDSSKATKLLQGDFDAMDETLTDMDDVVDTVQTTHPEFYVEYKKARIIIDRPGGHASPPPPAGPTPPQP